MTVSTLVRRASLVGLLALCLSVLPLAAASAGQPDPDPTPDQDSYVDLDAETNVEYSVRWSQFTFESADEVLIGREDLFPDNLASGSLQGQGDGRPLLLTPSDALSQQVIDEIARLGATTVHILGGNEAISEDVEADLEGLVDNVERHFGETRIETAIAISELVPSDTVIVARAFANDDPTQAFADSLAAGAWAADAGFPVLLTQTEVLTENTATALADGGYTNAFVVGGEAAIDSTTFDAIDEIVDNVERVGGANRFETAVLIANERGFASADDAEVTILTDGQGGAAWADGFPAAAFAAIHDAPLVLANSADTSLPPETVDFLSGGPAAFAQDAVANDLDPDVGLVCGPSVEDREDPDVVDDDDDPTTPSDNDLDDDPATTDADQCAEAAALRGLTNRIEFGDPTVTPPPPDNNQGLDVQTQEAQTLQVNEERQYTVDGVACVDENGDPSDVTIALFDAADMDVDEDGNVTFADENDNDRADNIGGTGGAFISVVNGSATAGNPNTVTAEPVGDAVNFTISSAAPDSVVPVVFCDADGDGQLDLDENDQPLEGEVFGAGGRTTFIPEEAPDGSAVLGQVVEVAEDGSYAIVFYDPAGPAPAGNYTVFFRDGDTYFIVNPNSNLCVAAADEEFFTNLSVGDFLSTQNAGPFGFPVAYDQDGENPFCLLDIAPSGPTNVTATQGNPSDTTVDLTWSVVAGADSYNVYVNDESCANTTPAELTLDGNVVDDTSPVEYTASGLDPSTPHCFVVTTVDGNDESALTVGTPGDNDDNTAEETTSAEVEAPIITSAALTTDAPLEGRADTGDVWTLTFNEAMNPATLAATIINLTDVDGDSVRVDCDAAAPVAGDFVTDATCALNPGPAPAANTVLTITLQENGEDRNAAGDGSIEYPLTITSITGLTDVDDGASPDVAASTDVTIP